MPIFACGINHKTAPVALREKIIFSAEKTALYLQDLLAHGNVKEAVVLSTCNRSELYCHAEESNQIVEWVLNQFKITHEELLPAWYCYEDREAVEHMTRVACGLDSMVLGEPQILGQVKTAFSESCVAGAIGQQFNRLFQLVFSVAKEVRTNTAIGACPVSIASAAINLAKKHFSKPFSDANILLIGAGDTIQLVLRHLQSQRIGKLIIANRNFDNAITLAEKFSAENIAFTELPKTLLEVDIVIAATGSPTPVVTKEMLISRQTPLLIIDIAVPRDVEVSVTENTNINLYSIDDLKSVIQQNRQGREHAAEKAQQVIKQRSAEFMAWMNSLDQVATTIRAYRQQIEALCSVELSKAHQQLRHGEDPNQVLSSFAQALTNKLLHHPSVQLRQAGVEGRFEMLEVARELFAI